MKRQESQRPGRREALPGGMLMGKLSLHSADDGFLIVVPFPGWQARPLANAGMTTVGAYHQVGGDTLTAGQG